MNNWTKSNKAIWIGALVGGLFGIIITFLSILFWTETRFLRYIAFYIPGKIMTIVNICPDWFRILDCPIIPLVTIIFYALIGALTGFIIQKVIKK